MSRSADRSFHLIAAHRGLVPREVLDAALERAREEGAPIERGRARGGHRSDETVIDVLRNRKRHGRRCADCGGTTYLLPRQTVESTPCEGCGGALQAGAADPPAQRPREGPTRPARGRRGGSPRRRPPRGRRPGRPQAAPPEAPGEPDGPDVAAADGARAAAPPAGGEGPPASEHREDEDGEAPTPPRGTPVPGGAPTGGAPAADDEAPAAAGAPGAASADEDRDTRSRRLRRAGAGFGYEPQEPVARERPPHSLLEAPTAPADPDPAADDARSRPPPEHGGASPAEDDARFRPPPEHGGAPPTEDDARFRPPPKDDDARFAPPPAHQRTIAGVAPKAAPPFRRELGRMLGLPVKDSNSIGILILGAILILLVRSTPVFVRPFVLLFSLYPYLYVARVIERAMLGDEELPAWPEFDLLELFGFGLRAAGVAVACFLPALFSCCLAFGLTLESLGLEEASSVRTIGPDAHLAAGAEAKVPTGAPAGDATFYTWDEDLPVSPGGGQWTILGLLARDTADDTGMSQLLSEMPRGGYGVAPIIDAYQIYDLERVGRVEPDVKVLAAYADPALKLIHARWPFTLPEDELRARRAPAEEPPTDAVEEEFGTDATEQLERARDLGRVGASAGSGAPVDERGRPLADPFEAVRIVYYDDLAFPEPFRDLERFPCVYVIDPEGEVVREYATGVHDEKLYADLRDLQRGGSGDAFPASLPSGSGEGGTPILTLLGWGLLVVTLAAGLFYYPMAMLIMVAFNSGKMPFFYAVGLRAIRASVPDYLALSGVLVGLYIVLLPLLREVLDLSARLVLPAWVASIVSAFLITLVGFYGLVASGWGIGRYYYANEEAIGWFSR